MLEGVVHDSIKYFIYRHICSEDIDVIGLDCTQVDREFIRENMRSGPRIVLHFGKVVRKNMRSYLSTPLQGFLDLRVNVDLLTYYDVAR